MQHDEIGRVAISDVYGLGAFVASFSEQADAQGKFMCSTATTQKAIVSYAHESLGQHVEKKTADEFTGF